MSADKRTLGELFREAAGDDRDELALGGAKLRLTVCGGVLVDGRELGELSSHEVEDLVRQLREAAEARLFDPEHNELLKFSDL